MLNLQTQKSVIGRVIEVTNNTLTILGLNGKISLTKPEFVQAQIGDWVQLVDGNIQVLSSNRSPRLSTLFDVCQPKKIFNLYVRSKVISLTRQFFTEQHFLDVQTPYLVQCPGMEAHIRTFEVRGQNFSGFLPTSPEFAMKVLLAGGLPQIFQISTCFRDEPVSNQHLPEFTMIEWYRAFSKLNSLMDDVEGLVKYLVQAILQKNFITYRGHTICVDGPWQRFKVNDLFQKWVNLNLSSSTLDDMRNAANQFDLLFDLNHSWEDLFFNIWLNCVEPKLPQDAFYFITEYPVQLAANAVTYPDQNKVLWAARFEAFCGPLELANAFEELTDYQIQLNRFKTEMRLREEAYGEDFLPTPFPRRFLEALEEGMPPASGIALGLDRLIMLLAGETDIRQTVWITPGH